MNKEAAKSPVVPVHPRPDFSRDTFLSLDGEWQFAFDDADAGLREGWQQPDRRLPLTIRVPFCYQSKQSGLGGDEIHPILWYRRVFHVPAEMRGQRLLIRFGAVDHACRVYVNGQVAGCHVGGYSSFAVDATPFLREGDNDLCLRVVDTPDTTQPRGKQYWRRGLMGCWYTPCSGIWQTVYLEAVGSVGLERLSVTPDIDRGQALVEAVLDGIPAAPLTLRLEVTLCGEPIRTVTVAAEDRHVRVPMDMISINAVHGLRLWSPHDPALYDLTVTVLSGEEKLDCVHTYFGMRKVEVADGQIRLNNAPLYLRMVLDQGYWSDTLLTPPDDDALRKDVEMTLALGFNGARKHQKVECPRYYYWADKLGLLVWGEVPSAYLYAGETVRNLSDTLSDFIARDMNHPSLIAWVPLNESWGVPAIIADRKQQAAARALYHLCKAMDGTRLVSGNDGWEQVETDICALHDYAAFGEELSVHFADRYDVERHGCDQKACYADGVEPREDAAFMVTEYGGIAFRNVGVQGEMGGMETWGYNGKVDSEDAFFDRYQSATDALRNLDYCQGYCYTQLTDVMQEINGLLTPQRQPKVDVARFRSLNRNPDGRASCC